MEVTLSGYDRALLERLAFELKRYNDAADERKQDRVLSVNDAARLSGRSRQTISRKIREGVLTKVSRGGVTGILRSELEKINPA
jgi:predicted DNA-binding transcriptional regulator AlpA